MGYSPTGQGPVARDKLYVDHCHKTGKVRGLLCSLCNGWLGRIRDNPEMARKAALYIERDGDIEVE